MNTTNSRKSLLYFCLFQPRESLEHCLEGSTLLASHLVTPCSIRSDSTTLDVTWRGITIMARLTIWKMSTYLYISPFILAWQKFINNGKRLHKKVHISINLQVPLFEFSKKFLPERCNKIYLFEPRGKKAKQIYFGRRNNILKYSAYVLSF